jgi:hypothetical protein
VFFCRLLIVAPLSARHDSGKFAVFSINYT